MALKQRYARIDKHPSRAQLQRFGMTLFCACALGAGWLHVRLHQPSQARWVLLFGVVLGVSALVPRLGRVCYVAWMGLGVTLGLVVSPVVLALVFYLVITPAAWTMRLCKRDAMRRTLDRSATSYWQTYPEPDDPARYMAQF
jgi:hypothetical protein